MLTSVKIAAATVVAGAFLMRGPDGCANYPRIGGPTIGEPAPTATNCVQVIGPDKGDYGQRIADALNAKDGC